MCFVHLLFIFFFFSSLILQQWSEVVVFSLCEIELINFVQIEWEDAHRLARRHMEREQGRKDATADMSSDLSEGEKESTPAETMPRVESSLALAGNAPGTPEKAPQEAAEKRLYIVLIRYTINKFEPVFGLLN